MPLSRLVRMRSRTSAMSASRSIGFGSPMWPKSNDGTALARDASARRRLRADGRGGARPRAAGADRVFALRCGTAEASLMHPVLVGTDLVLEVVTSAIDRDGHDAVRSEARKRPEHAVGTRRLDDPRLRLRREARGERVREVGDGLAGFGEVGLREGGTAADRVKHPNEAVVRH